MTSRLRLLAGVLALSLVASGGATAATGFSPKLLAGKWAGTWQNTTFGSTGPITATVKAPSNKKLVFTLDFGGNVFGCSDPAPETITLVRGNGLNRWNAAGFRGKRTSKAFGTMSLTYKHASKTLKGGGSNPACSSGLSWTLDGKFAGKKFTGKVTITLPDNQGSAVSQLEATRT